MCGIAGVLDFKGRRVSASIIERMNAAQRHRGPDDWGGVLIQRDGDASAGAWSARTGAPTEPASLGLGHVRLSIIDLTQAGHQPMSSADGSLWLVYNGEVYNYVELRRELESLGFRFRTKTDTEVVLVAYEAWGLDAFSRFNGMFSIALWDGKARRLACVRDRLGVKPFHYAEGDGVFAFASEIPALLTVGNVPRQADGHVLAQFLAWAELPGPEHTFFSKVKPIPAGHMLIVEASQRPRISRWWSPQLTRQSLRSADVVDGVRATLLDAVRLRLRSDVPVGVCLSGGLDSSAVACSMRHLQSDAKIRAFTARFRDPGLDESDYARQVVDSIGAEWHVVEPTSQGLNEGDLLHLIRAQGEPFPNLSMYAQFSLFRQMRQDGVPVALNGQGADELFWGYTWHYAFLLGHLARRAQLGRLTMESASILKNNHLPSRARLLVALGYYGLPFARELRAKLAHNSALTRECRDLASGPNSLPSGTRDLAASRRRELFVGPLPALLRYEDRNSMAFSVESRLPFLDFRLIELVLSIPETELIRGGWSKVVLRRAMEGILPEGIRWRRSKLGFDAPSSRLLSEVAPLVRDAFVRPRSADLVDPSAVTSCLASGSTLTALATRAIIVELWMREHAVRFDARESRRATLEG